MGTDGAQGDPYKLSLGSGDRVLPTGYVHQVREWARGLGWSLALLAAAFIVWFASGVPPPFIGLWPRLVALGWLLVGMVGVVVGVRAHRRARATGPSMRGARWPVWSPAWVPVVSGIVVVGAMVPLSFVVDGALPALVLGSDPERSVAQVVDFREASSRRDVDRTRVRFRTGSGAVVEAWAADPDYLLGPGTRVVFDTENPQRVMPERTWEEERSAPWRLPIAVLLWLGAFGAPFVIRWARSRWYGALRPGLHIVRVARVRRSNLVRLGWENGSSAMFFEVPGFREAVERRLHDDEDVIPLPWTRPSSSAPRSIG